MMQVDFSVLQGAYLQDLLSQPQALRTTVMALERLDRLPSSIQQYPSIVLTGMGSSLHALHPLQIHLVQSGHRAMMVETAELVYAQSGLLTDQTLVVAVSQSGRSAETVSLLERMGRMEKRPFLIGVTNTLDSPLAQQSDFIVPLVAGAEFSVSCKTYLCTLAALEWLAVALRGGDLLPLLKELQSASDIVQLYLKSWSEHVLSLSDRLRDVRHLFITGRGGSLAAVGTGALILKESTRFHAEGMSSPAFRHGPLEMVSPGLFALVFSGDPATSRLNERLVHDVIAAGGRAALVGERAEAGVFRLPRVSECLRPIVEMLPIQMISLALAAISKREPGLFERASKVTATE